MKTSPSQKEFRRSRQPIRREPINIYYRSTAGDSGPSPFQKKAAPRWIRRYILGFLDAILIILVLAGLVYSLMINPLPRVIVNNQAFHNLQAYQAYADQLFSRLKNRNKITYDEQAVAKALEQRFPEIINVSTELPVFSEKPTLRLNIAQASLRIKNGGANYIIDSQGVVVAGSSQLPTAKNLPQIIDQSGFTAKIGQPVLNVSAVNFIKTVVAETKAARVSIASLTLPPVAQELDLRAAGQSYFVKFYLGGDPLVQVGQYLAARSHFNQNHQPPAQYLDARVNGKIFFK